RGNKVDDGFVVSGRWPFSSGVDNSDWNMLAVTVYGDDGKTPAGKTPVDWRLCIVPKTDYRVIDTWYAMGMVGTGSKDIEVKEIFVPERRALALTRCRGGPLSQQFGHRTDSPFRRGVPGVCAKEPGA